MKRTRMSTLLALAAASMSAELHTNLGSTLRTKKVEDDVGAKNGLNCVDNGMAYTGGGSGITIERDAAGQSQSSIAALKTTDLAAKNATHSVPTSLLAAGHQGHRHAGARC
jgi:hypothetical protein